MLIYADDQQCPECDDIIEIEGEYGDLEERDITCENCGAKISFCAWVNFDIKLKEKP